MAIWGAHSGKRRKAVAIPFQFGPPWRPQRNGDVFQWAPIIFVTRVYTVTLIEEVTGDLDPVVQRVYAVTV